MANFTSIRASIFTKLKTMSTVDSTDVRDFGGGEPDGFPAITLEIIGNDSTVGDQATNLRVYKYRVTINIEMNRSHMGQETAEDTLGLVLDEIIDLFDNDNTLGSTVLDVIPTVTDAGYKTLAHGITRTSEIELQVRDCFTIT